MSIFSLQSLGEACIHPVVADDLAEGFILHLRTLGVIVADGSLVGVVTTALGGGNGVHVGANEQELPVYFSIFRIHCNS